MYKTSDGNGRLVRALQVLMDVSQNSRIEELRPLPLGHLMIGLCYQPFYSANSSQLGTRTVIPMIERRERVPCVTECCYVVIAPNFVQGHQQ